MTTPKLAVQATLVVPGFTNLALNTLPGYELEGSSLDEVATSWRRNEVSNPWVEGTYTISAVRENQVVPVSVWVRGVSHQEMRQRQIELERRVAEPRWELQLSLPGYTEYWTCQTSDTVVRTQREYLHAMHALVRIQVVRLPTVRYAFSTGDVNA